MSFYLPHARVTLDCGSDLVTKQSHKDECDIHKILNQYKKTGILSHISSRSALYVDLPDMSDYQQSIDVVRQADQAFASLPSVVRDRFSNDPEQFLAAVFDPARRAELVELGVFEKASVSSSSSSSSSSPSSSSAPGGSASSA